METVESAEVKSKGGKYKIELAATFNKNTTTSKTILYCFEPTHSANYNNPAFTLNAIEIWEHTDLKDPTEIENQSLFRQVKQNTESTNTDSTLRSIYSNHKSPYDPHLAPETVYQKLEELFGSEIAMNTKTNTIEDSTTIDIPQLPQEHIASIKDLTLKHHGTYTDTSGLNHNLLWTFTPVQISEQPELAVSRCFHKVWHQRTTHKFSEENSTEQLVELHQTPATAPDIPTLPDSIIVTLTRLFGNHLLKNSFKRHNKPFPTVTYECTNCDTTMTIEPHAVCPDCGNQLYRP
jgi:hypothetical protein